LESWHNTVKKLEKIHKKHKDPGFIPQPGPTFKKLQIEIEERLWLSNRERENKWRLKDSGFAPKPGKS
jgi:hypothetical protein